MKVLLTGAAGFIGGAIARHLSDADDGHEAEVVGVDLMLPAAHGASETPPGIHRVDVRDGEQMLGLLEGVDVVCHQAAMVGAGVKVADMPEYAAHNDLGTAVLLATMHEAGVDRLVVASSMVVYGEGSYACPDHGVQPTGVRSQAHLRAGEYDHLCPRCERPLEWRLVPEDTPLRPHGSYATSKLAQENYAAAWAKQGDGAAIALRYHNVYGPHMPRDTPYSGVAAMFRSALERGEAPRVFEDGAQMRDFVHVDDVARANVIAMRAVLEAPTGALASYNVCSGQPLSILDVAQRVAAGSDTSLEPVVTGEFRAADVRHVVASPELARQELGFTAEISPDEGLLAFATVPLRA